MSFPIIPGAAASKNKTEDICGDTNGKTTTSLSSYTRKATTAEITGYYQKVATATTRESPFDQPESEFRLSNWIEAEELRIALEATRTVEDLDIEGRALAEQLQPIKVYAATPAETSSPWPSKLGSTSISNRALCLLPIAVRAEIIHFVPQLHPTSRYLLALINMPGSSVSNEDQFDNSTSRLVIESILGRYYYTLEFLDLSIPVNAWVDLYRVKLECKNADSWMVRDHMNRVSRIYHCLQGGVWPACGPFCWRSGRKSCTESHAAWLCTGGQPTSLHTYEYVRPPQHSHHCGIPPELWYYV